MRRLFGCLWLVVLTIGLAACESKGTKITKLEPDYGSVAGRDDVVVHGSGFKPGMTVHFGRKQVSSVVVESPSTIRVKTPAGPEGQVDVTVTDETGKAFVLKNSFRYQRSGG